MRGIASKRRKGEAEDLVHARRGTHLYTDDFMVKALGTYWREDLRKMVQVLSWAEARKNFVARACRQLYLPRPPEFYLDRKATDHVPRDDTDGTCDLHDFPIPPALGRDALFCHGPGERVQAEFVVDNQNVANLANAAAVVTNAMHERMVHNVRRII